MPPMDVWFCAKQEPRREAQSLADDAAKIQTRAPNARTDSGTHLLCVHHSKKVSEEDATDNMLGSIALAGAVDTIIGLRDTRNVMVISTSQRYGNGMEDTILTFDAETRSLSLGSTTKAEVEESKRSTLLAISESIVAFVTNNPGCTENEVLAGVTGCRDAIRTQLRELLKSRLRREGKGVSGDPFLYYADVPVEDQNPP